jgi:hypothetical protein
MALTKFIWSILWVSCLCGHGARPQIFLFTEPNPLALGMPCIRLIPRPFTAWHGERLCRSHATEFVRPPMHPSREAVPVSNSPWPYRHRLLALHPISTGRCCTWPPSARLSRFFKGFPWASDIPYQDLPQASRAFPVNEFFGV